jgi:hypothetical protein
MANSWVHTNGSASKKTKTGNALKHLKRRAAIYNVSRKVAVTCIAYETPHAEALKLPNGPYIERPRTPCP